jgi:hypothetical protein
MKLEILTLLFMLLEYALRLIPTKRNMSYTNLIVDIMNNLYSVLEKYVPNNRKNDE